MPDLSLLETLVRIAWLAGAVAFVLGLIQMNSPATARNGNLLSAGGMAVAIIATIVFLLLRPSEGAGFNAVGWVIIAAGIALGGGLGLYTARTVKMTAMPQLVSLFNAVGGGAAALIAIDDYIRLASAQTRFPNWLMHSDTARWSPRAMRCRTGSSIRSFTVMFASSLVSDSAACDPVRSISVRPSCVRSAG